MKYSTTPMKFMETQKIFIFVIIILRINLTSQALYPTRYAAI
jgi:regulatory protein YycI of two-component signal transduction system YycFG